MVKSALYQGNTFIGEVEIHPVDSYTGSWTREIRISHLSKASERCPPLAVLHTLAPGGIRFKMETIAATDNSPLLSLHTVCLQQKKTAVVQLGQEELHLVAVASRKSLLRSACFWGFSVPLRLYESSLPLLNLRCLAIVFDLDETLIVANTMRSFEDKIDALQRRMKNEFDPQRLAGMLAEIKRYQYDKTLLKQYVESDQVVDNGKIFRVQSEIVPPLSDGHQLITRPVLRLQERDIILTRINPSIRDTSVLVRIRPAWEDLRSYLTAKGRKRFDVYVCTMAERDYALEMWRLLDPDLSLIDSTKLLDRVVCVKPGLRKSLLNVFQDGSCHPKMALVIDDRLKVWDEKDQPRVHVVPAFAPYYAPQAEGNSNIPVLCVARNVACNVRGAFFKEFDEGLLLRINEVLYEDELKDNPSAPDVANYLITEDDTLATSFNKDQPFFDGMSDVEDERRLKEANATAQALQPIAPSLAPRPFSSPQQVIISSSVAAPSSAMQITMPPCINQATQSLQIRRPSGPISLGPGIQGSPARSSGPLSLPDPGFQGSLATEEGEVPESELDPDTRRRLLILQHGQDTRDPTPSVPVRPSLNVSAAPVQPPGDWFPPEEDINSKQIRKSQNRFGLETETLHFDSKWAVHSSFLRGGDSTFPNERGLHENRRLQLSHGGDSVRMNHAASNYFSSRGEETMFGQTLSLYKAGHCRPTGALEDIAMKCGAKVEFRSTVCDTTELQFSIEAWLVGEKLGQGVGKTRKEAQYQAAEISLRNLADKYLSNTQSGPTSLNGDFSKSSQSKLNGFLSESDSYRYGGDDLLPVASDSEELRLLDQRLDSSKRASSVTSLKEICIAEGFNLDFQTQPASLTGSVSKGQVSAWVKVSGQLMGRGVGMTWEEAKLVAADEALQKLRSMLGQTRQKFSNSPRSSSSILNKRSKPDSPQVLQRIQSSGRYSKSETHFS